MDKYARKMTLLEKLVLAAGLLIIAVGHLLFYTNMPLFDFYTKEDHLVEWLTVIGLLMGSFVCLRRVFRLGGARGWMVFITSFLLGLVLFVAAGEEISWGQRILGIESPEYFKQNNTQQETNFHNLIIGGMRVNRWIFSFGLTAVLLFYLVILPILYRRKQWAKRLVQFWGVPLPQSYQTVSAVVLFVITQILPHEKKAELLECGIALLLFLVLAFPVNREDFVRSEK
jgi:hypothetical protein